MKTRFNAVVTSVWNGFCSLKLAMFILISLAVLSIIGTVIPQGIPPEEYLALIGPTKARLYQVLGFFDMYHSWWFILLLYLLTVNLICCSIKRLPRIWKIVFQPETIMTQSLESSFSSIKTISSKTDVHLLKEKTEAFLQTEFAKPFVREVDGSFHLFSQQAPWCRFSVYVVHLSIIIIFIGAIIGTQFGFKGYVTITEGQSVDRIGVRSGTDIIPGFSVRCEKFSLAQYPNGAPKEFKSILTVLEKGVPVPEYTNVRVIVNKPMTYKGITFYQSSYGNAGQYFFTTTDLEGKNLTDLTMSSNSSATLPDGSSIHVLETTPDISLYSPGLSGAAAQLEIHTPGGNTEQVVVYANHPELNIQHAKNHGKGPVLHYKGEKQAVYTGLQVAKDPGVWVVWAGCALMVAGIYIAFFLSHRRIWVRIQKGRVTIGGNAHKNPASFNLFFDQLSEKYTSHIS